MADEADIANDRAQRELDAALAAISHPADGLPSAVWCEECDEQIPEARRNAVPGLKKKAIWPNWMCNE